LYFAADASRLAALRSFAIFHQYGSLARLAKPGASTTKPQGFQFNRALAVARHSKQES
jgi:hypothetical protein